MSRTAKRGKQPNIGRDILIIAFSVILAVLLGKTDVIPWLMSMTGFLPAEAFAAGFFFTSLLTLAPATVALAEMMQLAPILSVAAWGAAGAVVGDLVLFLVVRDVVSDDLMGLLRGSWGKKIKALFRTPFLSWAVPVMGALIIASPLPDEVGIAMLGLSKADLRFLIPVSYAMNFIGIVLVGLVVRVM